MKNIDPTDELISGAQRKYIISDSQYCQCLKGFQRHARSAAFLSDFDKPDISGIDCKSIFSRFIYFASSIAKCNTWGSHEVQHQLGHEDSRVTARYAHLLPENQSVVDKIDGMGTTTILLQSKEKELPETGNS